MGVIVSLIRKILLSTLLIGWLFLSSCTTLSVAYTDDEMLPYIEKFMFVTGADDYDMVMVTIKFRTLPDKSAGSCSYVTREISIDPEKWFDYTEMEKTGLIFHELGHCVFNLKHDSRILEGTQCGISFMHYQMQNDRCIKLHWEHYIDDFNGRLR